ncbi:acetyltransferase-like isoleucine patch superfamily enzyme [Devosia sp. UYZn731]|uniref:acyltransferase n=1 Tax=Devosia sp. UYZn731 TaxID=3156345 RepID=UPI00339494E3
MHKFFRLSVYKDRLLGGLAKHLRPYLARTPLIWGDAGRLKIGRNVQLVDAIINLRSGTVTIDDDAFLGHGVMLLTGKHPMRKSRQGRHRNIPTEGRDIIIRYGAWVASGAIVVGPCDIGENAVIGAGSVVTGNIPAGALYAGNPGQLIRILDIEDEAQ